MIVGKFSQMIIVFLLTRFCFLYICFRKLNLLKADVSKDDNNGEGQDNSVGSCSIPEVHILNQVRRGHEKPCLVSRLAPDFLLWQQHAFNIGFNFDWRSSCLICKSHTLSVSLVDGQSNQANNSHRIVFVALLYISYPSYLVFIGLLNKWFHSLLHLIHLLQLCVGAGSSERSG